MLQEQIVLVVTILITFCSCIALTKLAARYVFPSFELLQTYDSATNFMDLNILLAFVVGLICSVGVLYWIESSKSSKPVLDPTSWKKFKPLRGQKLAM